MSEGEEKLVDTQGDYLYAVKNGEPLPDAQWRSCRIVISSERLVLSTSSNKQAIPHSKILVPEKDEDLVPDGMTAPGATALQIGNNVILVDAQEMGDFESEYCRAALHDEVILVKYPAIVGGVVQEDASWSKARFRLDDDEIVLGLPDNETVTFPIDDVGTVETATEQVAGEQREVVKVEHTDEEDRSVETHFSGVTWHPRALATLLRNTIENRQNEYELDDLDSQVLMALYSGVSPFEMADFVGTDVEEVEEIYQKLLDAGAVDKVRERTEVSLNAKGRNLASEAMNEK
ncbi:CheF family chemotaxis protein [Halovenus sp. HT40]|uniref:CheF family chemotaxis protein n=1 Tax=Halovenus sp. HT40 TaxID=3126691 RepID=UPI00300F3411